MDVDPSTLLAHIDLVLATDATLRQRDVGRGNVFYALGLVLCFAPGLRSTFERPLEVPSG